MRRWLARVWSYDWHPGGIVWDADTGRSLVEHLRGCPVATYPEHGWSHAPLSETQRRGGPEPEAIVGEVLESWATADGVDALLELLDGASRTDLSLAYQRKLWPQPGGDRVEIITHVWSVDLVARSACGGRLVREADAALCWKLTGSVAPRGQWLDRLALGLAPPARRRAGVVPDPRPAAPGRSAARLAEILSDDGCLPFTLAPEGDRS